MKTEVIVNAIRRGIDIASRGPHNDETAAFLEGLATACEYLPGVPATPLSAIWEQVKELQATVMTVMHIEKEQKQAETDREIAKIRDIDTYGVVSDNVVTPTMSPILPYDPGITMPNDCIWPLT